MNIYEIEKALEKKVNDSADDVLNYAILETVPPISDYSFAIKVLSDNYTKYNDFRIAVLASFLSSTWENYKQNDFLQIIYSFFVNSDNQQKSIILYLNAYDILMHDDLPDKYDKYFELLSQSVNLSERFAYNYYRLAQVSMAKYLTKKALFNVEKVYDEKDFENMKISDLVLFDSFLEEHILGVAISQQNFIEIQKLYNSL